jgi:galactitol PTS system EIIA component
VQEMFNKDLIDMHVAVKDEQQLFDLIGIRLIEKNMAKLGYISGLEKRELAYPTGLQFPDLPLALPHVDPEYIQQPFIYVVRNNCQINVKQMGDSAEMKSANFLFLGLKDGAKQPELLAKIMQAFQDGKFVEQYVDTDSNDGMYQLLISKFGE